MEAGAGVGAQRGGLASGGSQPGPTVVPGPTAAMPVSVPVPTAAMPVPVAVPGRDSAAPGGGTGPSRNARPLPTHRP